MKFGCRVGTRALWWSSNGAAVDRPALRSSSDGAVELSPRLSTTPHLRFAAHRHVDSTQAVRRISVSGAAMHAGAKGAGYLRETRPEADAFFRVVAMGCVRAPQHTRFEAVKQQ